MERSGKRYSGKPDGGAKRSRNAQKRTLKETQNLRNSETQNFFRNSGIQDLGFRGTEGLEGLEVTRARFLNFGIELFQRKKHFRVVSRMEDFR